jgi:hypothetical protein
MPAPPRRYIISKLRPHIQLDHASFRFGSKGDLPLAAPHRKFSERYGRLRLVGAAERGQCSEISRSAACEAPTRERSSHGLFRACYFLMVVFCGISIVQCRTMLKIKIQQQITFGLYESLRSTMRELQTPRRGPRWSGARHSHWYWRRPRLRRRQARLTNAHLARQHSEGRIAADSCFATLDRCAAVPPERTTEGSWACAWVLRCCDTVQVHMTVLTWLVPLAMSCIREAAGQTEADWLFRCSWPIKDQSSAFRSQPKYHTSLKRFDT